MHLSVVVAAHNDEAVLGTQLDALAAQTLEGDWEVVVVDNAPSDGTADLVRQRCVRNPRLRLVSAAARADRSYALNEGIAAASSDHIAFCDADDLVDGRWAEAMADALGRAQVVTGRSELDLLNPPWLANSRGRSDEQPAGFFAGIFPMIRGNNWGIERQTYERLGGLAERYHPCEDLELSYRCWINDVDVVGVPDAVVHYRYRTSVRTLWRQGLAYGTHRPQIAKLLREAGRQRPAPFTGWKSWLRTRAGRGPSTGR